MKAIFLDRDGVVNKYPGDTKYVTSWREFRFLPRAKMAVAKLYQDKYKIFVVSNQAGVGKGIYSQEALNVITKNMRQAIVKSGGKIEKAYYCIHRQEENCACRKPKAGLVDKAKKDYPSIDLQKSFFIGDTIRDVHTAQAAGCSSILVLSGKEKLAHRKNWEAQPDFIFRNLWEAANFILKQK